MFYISRLHEDFKTVNGKEYKDATVTRVDPDGVVVKTKSENRKFTSSNCKGSYDSEKAASYSAEQSTNYTAYQKQQDETQNANNRPPTLRTKRQ